MLYIVFFASGFAAVIYQVIWQRALLALYGANIESVTMVVAAFMLGLGLGSLLGGRLASRPSVDLPALFGLMEFGIGLWGVLSLRVFQWVGTWTADAAPAVTAAAIFGLLLVPTVLMGATLPVLVSHVARQTATVGQAVGGLYSINALGSAAGAVMAVLVLFGSLGQHNSVLLAASMNVAVAILVLWRRRVAHA